MESIKKMILKELSRREIPNDVKRKLFSLKKVAFDILYEEVLSDTLSGQQTVNALQLLRQMRFGDDPNRIFDLALKLALHRLPMIRQSAVQILISLTEIDQWNYIRPGLINAKREIVIPILKKSESMGCSQSCKEMIQRFIDKP